MDGLLGQSDGLIRLAAFAAVFLLMAAIELIRPKRRLSVSKARRWLTNLGIAGVDTLVLRLMAALAVPVAAVAAAFFAKERGLGLLNQVDWPYWLKLVIALLALDLAIWFQHLVSHKVPVFWRLHQVHHADRDIDVTTAIRFHPVEIGLSMLWKIAVVIPLGASPFAVFCSRSFSTPAPCSTTPTLRSRHGSTGHCASSSSRRTCIACTTRCCATSMIGTTASICRYGTGCSGRTLRSRRRDTKV